MAESDTPKEERASGARRTSSVAAALEGGVVPFVVEADHPRNCDILVQSIPGCRLRSKVKALIQNATEDGSQRTPQIQGAAPPSVPGMRLAVNPAECKYVVLDPLNEDEAARERLQRFLYRIGRLGSGVQVRGEKELRGTLDQHRMKTLCRELHSMVQAGEVRVVQGPVPQPADIEGLPGKFLLNPGSRVQNSQPQFEEDYEGWVSRMTRAGA